MTEVVGPYMILTTREYSRMGAVITQLRWTKQKARELLEQERYAEAKALLTKTEEEP